MTSRFKQAARWTVGYSDDQPETISSGDYLRQMGDDPKGKAKAYVRSLFPFLTWLPNYNFTWLIGDLIAGITVGMVLVPQSMSYAKLAGLRPEFGLYSSFIGVFCYAFFATSKDVSIGPVAVMSLETGRIVAEVLHSHPGKWPAEVIATQLAFICGFIVLGIGLLRLGWIVEFIPVPAVAGFMTGSAISIVAGQVPGMFGISSKLNTRAATYKVIIDTFKNLKFTTLDAAFGIPCLVGLYAMKWTCNWVEKRFPRYRRTAFFVSVTRNALMVIIFTVAAWRVTVHEDPKHYSISILKTVPSGFRNVGPPVLSSELIGAMASKLPVATIILLLEHISIAKSFGRLNNYKIDPNQELIAIGVNNCVGTLFQAYPSTGSFSRSALKSKSGVRTPAAGWPTGLCVIIALYALTDAFYFIPNAALSAIIIHAVADLVISPRGAYGFWKISPFEFFIWLGAVLITVFTTIEIGIYFSLAASLVLLLFRIARPGGHFLGRVRVALESGGDGGEGSGEAVLSRQYRDVYVPFNANKNGLTNQRVRIEPPPAGVIIYRFEESFIYPNASYHNSQLVDHVKATTKRGHEQALVKLGDRPWNDPGPSRLTRWRNRNKPESEITENLDHNGAEKVLLRAIVLDFQAVANLDTTGVQNLVDTRKEVERWTGAPVSFHFSGILSPWIQRALIAGGFGTSDRPLNIPVDVATVVPQDPRNIHSVQRSPEQLRAEQRERDRERYRRNEEDGLEIGLAPTQQISPATEKGEKSIEDERDVKYGIRGSEDDDSSLFEPLVTSKLPLFHFDLEGAVRAATAEAKLPPRDAILDGFTLGH